MFQYKRVNNKEIREGKMKEKIIYYEDELNDEFSTAKIEPRKIDENYKYIHICSQKSIISI